ncbi:hypothetical protein KQ1_02478 [Bacillus cereus BAG3O-1]|nr:hypothetical protein KQ1_02478 [Bacillus cereus BAG3O-1]
MSEKEEKEKKWFPRRWGKRKVSEHLSQLNKKKDLGYNLCYRFVYRNYSLYSKKI